MRSCNLELWISKIFHHKNAFILWQIRWIEIAEYLIYDFIWKLFPSIAIKCDLDVKKNEIIKFTFLHFRKLD